jgi:hypothetical protein
MKGKNTLLIVTADHGQVSTTLKRTIILNKHPLFRDCLARPLCGEARTIFCFVLPQKRQQFERYFRRNFSHYAELYPSRELAEKGFFGQHQPHPRFWERIGDYIILPKENYVFREFLPQEERRLLVGYHGGLSSEEMLVPLVVARF